MVTENEVCSSLFFWKFQENLYRLEIINHIKNGLPICWQPIV
jgi:hypothetical protein